MNEQSSEYIIRSILNRDPAWCAYALADLQPAFQPHCHWSLAGDEGLAVLFTLLDPPALVTVGSAEAVRTALDGLDLPESIYLNVREEHLPIVQERYTLPDGPIAMLRMAWTAPPAAPVAAHARPVRLTPADAERMRTLYRHGGPFTPDAFDPYQIDNGVFFGIERGKEGGTGGEESALLAVGGTHIVDWEHGVAAIGNMYTHPKKRGHGYASAILHALWTEFAARQIHTAILNVDQRNGAAQRLYQRMGFAVHCPYIEGVAKRRKLSR